MGRRGWCLFMDEEAGRQRCLWPQQDLPVRGSLTQQLSTHPFAVPDTAWDLWVQQEPTESPSRSSHSRGMADRKEQERLVKGRLLTPGWC